MKVKLSTSSQWSSLDEYADHLIDDIHKELKAAHSMIHQNDLSRKDLVAMLKDSKNAVEHFRNSLKSSPAKLGSKEHGKALSKSSKAVQSKPSKKAADRSNIWTVYAPDEEEGIDYNYLIRGANLAEVKKKAKRLPDGVMKKAYAFGDEDFKDFGITDSDIAEMDKVGYYCYDSGT